MSEEKKVEVVSEEEKLKLHLLHERAQRNEVTQQLLSVQIQQLRTERQQIAKEQAEVWTQAAKKYGLEMNDQINFATGIITRMPKLPVLAPPPPLAVVKDLAGDENKAS